MTSNYLIIPIEEFNDLSMSEKIVLSQLAYMKKAFETLTVSNAYLSKKLGLSSRTIQRALSSLSNLNYIRVSLIDNTKRTITLSNQVLNIFGIKTYVIDKNAVKREMNPILKEFLTS